MKHTRVSFDLVRVRKEGSRALVTGIAYPALDPPEKGAVSAEDASLRIDTYKTWMRRDTLRKFAHTFLKRGTGGVDSHHDHGTVGTIVESYLTPEGHPEFPADVWVVTSEVYDPGTLQELADEKIKGYSIEFVAEIQPVTLTVEGAGKVRTGEIVDPTPLFLSLVEKPAIRQPFRAVEFREAQDETPPDCGRVTRIVRCEEPMPNDDDTAPATPPATRAEAPATPPVDATPAPSTPATTEPATRTDAPAAPAVSEATPTASPEGAALVQAMRDEFARLVAGVKGGRAAERLGAEHVATIDAAVRATVASRPTTQARAEVSFFKEIWDANHAKWAVMDALSSAFYLFESCYYECIYYASGSLEARMLAFVACLDDFRVVALDLAAEAATVEARATIETLRAKAATLQARAGKSISKKNMDKIKGCRDHARACCDDLQSMIDEHGGEPADDGEGEDEGERSERATKAPEATPPAATEAPAELVALRARVETLTTEARTTAETLAARDAEVATLRTELDAARAAQAAAEKRAAELAEAPAPPQAQSIERGATPPAAPAQPASRWAGFADHVIPADLRPPNG